MGTFCSKAYLNINLKWNRLYKVPLNVLFALSYSFHVGWQYSDPMAYTATIVKAYTVTEIAKDLGFNITVLDLGGGFQVSKLSETSFQDVSQLHSWPKDDTT